MEILNSSLIIILSNLFIDFISSKDFSNLFLIASLKEGNNLVARDTLEYTMSDEKGAWLGSGFLELKESKLLWKESFLVNGEKPITAEIEHAVRFNGAEDGIDGLEGIVGVGLALEAISN